MDLGWGFSLLVLHHVLVLIVPTLMICINSKPVTNMFSFVLVRNSKMLNTSYDLRSYNSILANSMLLVSQ
jgi:serine protease inhibitor ecotin